MNNDPGFFTTLSTAIGDKADKSTTYTRTDLNDYLDAKVDDTEMTNYELKTDVTAAVSSPIGTAPENLNTLQEIAASIDNKFNFSTTVVNAIATKANIADVAGKFDLKTFLLWEFDPENPLATPKIMIGQFPYTLSESPVLSGTTTAPELRANNI